MVQTTSFWICKLSPLKSRETILCHSLWTAWGAQHSFTGSTSWIILVYVISSNLACWLEILSEYNMERPGKQHANANVLSRSQYKTCRRRVTKRRSIQCSDTWLFKWSPKDIQKQQWWMKIKLVIQWLEKDAVPLRIPTDSSYTKHFGIKCPSWYCRSLVPPLGR